jgi:NADH-quinone oxidoreductase subunit A
METVNAVPVFLYIVVLTGMAVGLLVVSRLLNPRQFVGPVQKMPYESGMDPIHDTRRRFDVRFHLIAIAFLVFDVEVLFLYPWAVAAKRPDPTAVLVVDNSGSMSAKPGAGNMQAPTAANAVRSNSGYNISTAIADGLASDRNIVFGGVAVFFVLLALGFVYDWRKGVFQWR